MPLFLMAREDVRPRCDQTDPAADLGKQQPWIELGVVLRVGEYGGEEGDVCQALVGMLVNSTPSKEQRLTFLSKDSKAFSTTYLHHSLN